MDTVATGLRDPLPHEEEKARADFYALLGRLYSAGPDANLLAAIAAAAAIMPAEGDVGDYGTLATDLAAAWQGLARASAETDAKMVASEYDELFIGVGKSEVNLHASHWLSGFMMEKPLVELRATLASLGLARQERATLVEDHLAALCEIMRLLVAGDEGRPPARLQQQRAFFEQHIASWAPSCCTAIQKCPIANYYRKVAQFTYCYLALEHESLGME